MVTVVVLDFMVIVLDIVVTVLVLVLMMMVVKEDVHYQVQNSVN